MISHLTRVGLRRATVLGCAVVVAAIAPALAGHGHSTAAPTRHVTESVPGQPGTPQPPTEVFVENFENRGATPVRLTAYTGAQGMTYTADPPWLINCNGWVAAYSDPAGGSGNVPAQVTDCTPAAGGPGSTGITAWNNVRLLAQALGTFNGSANPNTNHAVSAYTNGSVNSGNPGANFVEFATNQAITLPQSGRFLTFSVNAAETSCAAGKNHALLNYFLVEGGTGTTGGTEIPINSQPLDPCTGGTQIGTTGYWVGSLKGNTPVLYTASTVSLRMRNAQGSGDGNDHAFDDIVLLDVTPQLDKDFSPDSVEVGGNGTLTYTITNTNDLLPKDGWDFTDTLPSGLTLANPSGAVSTCPAGTVTAPDGGTAVTVTGGALAAGEKSCTVTVDVTSNTAGTYTNTAANISGEIGINLPGDSSITFVRDSAAIAMTKSATPKTYSGAGQTIHYSYHVTNTGKPSLTEVGVTDLLTGVTAVKCPRALLNPGDSETCTATYVTTQADVDRGSILNVAYAHALPAGGTTRINSPNASTTVYLEVPVTG